MSDNKLKYVFDYVLFNRKHFFSWCVFFMLFCSVSNLLLSCGRYLLILVFILVLIEKALIQGVFDKVLLAATHRQRVICTTLN